MESKVLILMGFLAGMVLVLSLQSSEAFGTFGFEIHHRYSHPVKGILNLTDDLPEKGTPGYYAAMAHRDRLIRGRHLADTAPLIFATGNDTLRINSLGFLYYANVTVGTPELWFLVALDTGSNLFWLPCDCRSCVTGLVTRSGQEIVLNMYSPNASSTSTVVPCNSNTCSTQRVCSVANRPCQYQIQYLSNGTSSTGVLVEDVLQMVTDDSQPKFVNAQVTIGCGIIQTGGFLDGAAPNGLFGLGMGNISVPSTLARNGLAANSFSMCFGYDGIGRIVFGDKGSSGQGETPFNLHQPHATYNISITQITVADNVTNVGFTAIFDSGTSFTYLNDPAYRIITQNFNSQVKQPRLWSNSQVPFEYCYSGSPTQIGSEIPALNFTMNGGDELSITNPVERFNTTGGGYAYCLALVKSADVNIIGQNFMTGYRVIFDREKMALGWKASDCNVAEQSNTGSNTPPTNPQGPAGAPSPSSVAPAAPSPSAVTLGAPPPSAVTPGAPPPSAVTPGAISGETSGPPEPIPARPQSPAASYAPNPNSSALKFLIFLLPIVSHFLIILW